jgi:hypothetical protein
MMDSVLTDDALHLSKLSRLLGDTHGCGCVVRSRMLRRDNFLVEPRRAAKSSSGETVGPDVVSLLLFWDGAVQRQSRRARRPLASPGTRPESPAENSAVVHALGTAAGRTQYSGFIACVQPRHLLLSCTRCALTCVSIHRPPVAQDRIPLAARSKFSEQTATDRRATP